MKLVVKVYEDGYTHSVSGEVRAWRDNGDEMQAIVTEMSDNNKALFALGLSRIGYEFLQSGQPPKMPDINYSECKSRMLFQSVQINGKIVEVTR